MHLTEKEIINILKDIENGVPSRIALNLTETDINILNNKASIYYKNGNFEYAAKVYMVLILLNNKQANYYFGLAACKHQLQQYRSAIPLYMMSAAMNLNTPTPFYYAADCCLRVCDFDSAVLMLKLAITYAGNNPEYQQIKEKANLTLNWIESGKGMAALQWITYRRKKQIKDVKK